MTYSEYRHTFAKPDEFIRAFGSLSEEEAKELVSTIEGSNAIKACAITTWRMARKKLEGEKHEQKVQENRFMKTKSKIKQCFVITTFVMAALLVFTSCDKDRFSRRSFIYNQPKETITEIDIVYVWNRDIEVLQTISEDEKEAFLNAFDQLIFAPYLPGEPMGMWGTCIRITYENGSYELVNSIWSEYYEHPGESGWFGWKYCTDEARFQELIDKYYVNSAE